MDEPLSRVDIPGATGHGRSLATTPEIPGDVRTQYISYRAPGSEWTPPTSPLPSNPHASPAARRGFGSSPSKHPTSFQLDSPTIPAYDHTAFSPSPSSSPTLPPASPSIYLPTRQRAPSLLRHAATPSQVGEDYPRTEQAMVSPTFSPRLRQGSNASDLRTIFNPLASNPVNHNRSLRGNSPDDVVESDQRRARGLTSSSQPGFIPHPPLRAATSIPDYGQYRGTERPNPSGAYRPNRGGANWSHNDHFPQRHFLPEEARSSFRSAWTNASSSFMDMSGTERSSMATGRSSISDNCTSVYSMDQSKDQDLSSDPLSNTKETKADGHMSHIMSVEDVIDSYCYGDDEEVLMEDPYETSRLSSSPVGASDSEAPGLSQTYSQSDRGSSSLTPEPFPSHEDPQQLDERPLSYLEVRDGDYEPQEGQLEQGITPIHQKQSSMKDNYLPPIQLSPVDLHYKSENHDVSPVSPISPVTPGPDTRPPLLRRQQYQEIHKELKELPDLPQNKDRLSRQDWAQIQAYSNRKSRGLNKSLDSIDPSSPKRPALAVHIPPVKPSDPLPEVDEDEAYPRRASTSVFDRRSTLFELTKALASAKSPPTNWRNLELQKPTPATGKRQSGQTIANSPVSPISSVKRFPSNGLVPSTTVVERDRYGFKKATHNVTVQEYDAWYNKYEQYVNRRKSKWIALMERGGFSTAYPVSFPAPSEKVRRYARKGYPPEWRGAMWWFYSGGQRKLAQMPGVYASLVMRVKEGELNKDDGEAIERDLDRTFPDNINFRPDTAAVTPEGKPQQEPDIVKDLREVLQCFALNNPGIGYCQSLNFIAGLLLLFMKQDNEKVFILLTIITQYHLPGAHARSLANTEVNVLMMLIKEYLPKVWASINDTDLINNGPGSHAHPDSKFQRQPTVALSCTSWFMSVFVGVLPIEVVLRVWDAFLYEGTRALYRYALAIFKLGQPEIQKFHPGDGELFMTVQNLPRRCLDPNILHDLAFVKKGFGSLSQNVIDQKRQFWHEQEKKSKQHTRPNQKPKLLSVDSDLKDTGAEEEKAKSSGGLRRKASRRFFKRDKA